MNRFFLFIFIPFLKFEFHAQTGFCFTSAIDSNDIVLWGSKCVTADFNNDGKQDACLIAQSNSVSLGVSVFLSTGNGSFFPRIDFPISPFNFDLLKDIKVFDFNGDGNQDIAIIRENTNLLYYATGMGNGSFTGLTTFSLSGLAVALDQGDFNADGKMDLAVATSSFNAISIFMNNSSGSFSLTNTYSLSSVPKLLVAADFNASTSIDLLVTSQSSSSFLKNSSGTFTLGPGFVLNADNIIVSDINSDGKPDLICADQTANTVTTFTGGNNFTFGQAWTHTITMISKSLAWTDMNGDSKKDLVAASSNTSILVFPGTGLGTIQPPVSYAILLYGTVNLLEFSVFDADGNNKPDIACVIQEGTLQMTNLASFINCNTVGIKEIINKQENIHLFPNPATNYIELQIGNKTILEKFNTVSIYNNLNQFIKEEELYPENAKIKVSDLSDGVYFLQLKDKQGQVVNKRVIVNR
jgi:hypothetical protein